MEAQHLCRLSVTLAWIFFVSFLCAVTGMNGLIAEIKLNRTVYVAFSGENLSINITLYEPSNQTSGDHLTCSDPSQNLIHKTRIDLTRSEKLLQQQLKNVSQSGLYSCKYKTAEVKWFLRVTGHRMPQTSDYTEIIIVAVFTGLLLAFSVLGSVYIFRGHWNETSSQSLSTNRKQKQNRDNRKETEKEENDLNMATAQSSSFYASLEPRPRSIYDVLDCSPAKNHEQQTKPESSKDKHSKVVEQDAANQDEGILECVYENF